MQAAEERRELEKVRRDYDALSELASAGFATDDLKIVSTTDERE
jgi:hypothetical protein